MIWSSKKNNDYSVSRHLIDNSKKNAFSLMEVVTATAILGLICSSVLIVIDRCITSSTNSIMRIQAFEVAREQMEALLSKDSVEETVEYGVSEKYPGIEWKTVVETFYEPLTSSMWLRGICTAEYKDTSGQNQAVELIHWLTGLSSEQLLQIMNQQGQELLAAQLIETVEEAAEYAGVDSETIEQWIDNGMLTTEDGFFIKDNLDIYMRTGGDPSDEEKNQQITSKADLLKNVSQSEVDPKTGLTYEQLEQMDVSEVWDILKNQQK